MRTCTTTAAPLIEFRGGTLTLGNFDGLHLGHQALFKAMPQGPNIVMTFDPHPRQVLAPGKPLNRIFPRADLQEQLPRYGVDLLVVLPFTGEMARQTAAEFWQTQVHQPFAPRHIVVGHDFAFGRAREGTTEFLERWCADHHAQLHKVKPLVLEGEIISSRLIRDFIRHGRMPEVTARLGRPFYLRGEVGRGAGRGATIGVPTINFKPINEILPAQGVYATFTHWQGKRLPSVTNIGINPTFGGQEGVKIETHVLEQNLEARGTTLDVEFIRFLRGEKKFASIEDLKKQIKDDILKAHETLDQP